MNSDGTYNYSLAKMGPLNIDWLNSRPSVISASDRQKFYAISLSDADINALDIVLKAQVYGGFRITRSLLADGFRMTPGQIQRLNYLYKIYTGAVKVNLNINRVDNETVNYYKKMNRGSMKITVDDLARTSNKLLESGIPRFAVVHDIPNGSIFSVWNSKQYTGEDKLFEVMDVTPENIIIMTGKLPKPCRFGQSAGKIIKILDPKEVDKTGQATREASLAGKAFKQRKIAVKISKKYCAVTNRYIIVGSLQRSEMHFGEVELLCGDGTIVHLYAKPAPDGNTIHLKGGRQRIYDFGVLPEDIVPKLKEAAKNLGNHLGAVRYEYIAGSAKYSVMPVARKVDDGSSSLIVD